MKKILHYLQSAFACVLIFLSITAGAIEPGSSSHVIQSGDINNDGKLDYLWKGEDKFVLVSVGKISVPIVLDAPDVLLQSTANDRFEVVTNISESLASSSIWQSNTTHFIKANLNGDGYGDIVLLANGHNHRGVTLYGAAGDSFTIGHFIDEVLIGSTALSNFDTLVAQDSDNNGTDDLLFYDNGKIIALAYSNGNQFSSITQTEPSDPFAVTSQWRHISKSNQDVFSPAPPNSAGISINRVDSFNITDRPAIISNFAGTSWTENGEIEHGAAKTIVIMTDSVNLSQPVKVLGAKADLFFITESPTGGFNCNSCSFEGLYRISVVTQGSSSALNANATDLGRFMPGPNTSASFTNLKAPNAIGLDILTENINSNASADLTQQVSVLEDGLSATQDPIVADSNGQHNLSSGSINLLLGDIEWGYHDNKMTSTPAPRAGEKTITGNFKAKTVRIGSTSSLIVESNAFTITDYASAVSYKGTIFLPEESIDYQSIAGDLTVRGTINSNGKVRYKANGKLTIETVQSTIHGSLVKAVAGGHLEIAQGYKLTGIDIDIGASKVINSGSIQATNKLDIFSRSSIQNQYGGEMFGEYIHLDAEGIIRNGSRTPYQSNPTTEALLDMSQDLMTKTNGRNTEAGTFHRMPYSESVDVSPVSLRVLQANQKAHIAGANIIMKAKAVENLNPYYLHVADQDTVNLQRDKVNQVGIYGENSLKLLADEYIINASGLIYLNQAGSALKLEAPTVVNERYRLEIMLEYTTSQISEDQPEYSPSFIDEETLDSRVVIFSPPGVIRSAGQFHVMTSNGGSDSYFLNNAGYIEIFGEVQIDSPNLLSRGYQNQAIVKNTINSTTYVSYSEAGPETLNYIPMQDIGPVGAVNTVTPLEAIIEAPTQLDSKFYAGDGLRANANDSMTKIEIFTPLDEHIQLSAAYLAQRDLSWVQDGRAVDHARDWPRFETIRPAYYQGSRFGCENFEWVSSITAGTIFASMTLVCEDFWNHVNDLQILNSEILPIDIQTIKESKDINLVISEQYQFNLDLHQIGACDYFHSIYETTPEPECFNLSLTVDNYSSESQIFQTVESYPLFEALKDYYETIQVQLPTSENEKHWWNQ